MCDLHMERCELFLTKADEYFEAGDYDTAAFETFRKLNEYVCAYYDADPSGSGSLGGCAACSCRNVGLFSLAACTTCVAYELSQSNGG